MSRTITYDGKRISQRQAAFLQLMKCHAFIGEASPDLNYPTKDSKLTVLEESMRSLAEGCDHLCERAKTRYGYASKEYDEANAFKDNFLKKYYYYILDIAELDMDLPKTIAEEMFGLGVYSVIGLFGEEGDKEPLSYCDEIITEKREYNKLNAGQKRFIDLVFDEKTKDKFIKFLETDKGNQYGAIYDRFADIYSEFVAREFKNEDFQERTLEHVVKETWGGAEHKIIRKANLKERYGIQLRDPDKEDSYSRNAYSFTVKGNNGKSYSVSNAFLNIDIPSLYLNYGVTDYFDRMYEIEREREEENFKKLEILVHAIENPKTDKEAKKELIEAKKEEKRSSRYVKRYNFIHGSKKPKSRSGETATWTEKRKAKVHGFSVLGFLLSLLLFFTVCTRRLFITFPPILEITFFVAMIVASIITIVISVKGLKKSYDSKFGTCGLIFSTITIIISGFILWTMFSD